MFRCNGGKADDDDVGAPKHQTIVFSIPSHPYPSIHTHTHHSHLLVLYTASNIEAACCTVQLN